MSRLALGTMTWGRDTDEHEAREQFEAFVEAGGTLIDTADVYTDGESERLVGRILAERGLRDEVVLATKAVGTPHEERRRNATRAHLLTALDRSLQRLGTEFVESANLRVGTRGALTRHRLHSVVFELVHDDRGGA